MKNLSKINPKLLLFLGVVGVSLSAIFVKYSSAPSLVTATYRLAWTVAILIPLSLKKSLPEIKQFTKKKCLPPLLQVFSSHCISRCGLSH